MAGIYSPAIEIKKNILRMSGILPRNKHNMNKAGTISAETGMRKCRLLFTIFFYPTDQQVKISVCKLL